MAVKSTRPTVNWPKIFILAIVIFFVSLVFGKWLGAALLGSSVAVNPSFTKTADMPPMMPPSPAPDESQTNRQDIAPPPLVLPPPVVSPSAVPKTEPQETSPLPVPAPVEPEPSSTDNAAAPPAKSNNDNASKTGPTKPENFKIQLGSFTKAEYAEKLVNDLLEKGFSGNVETVPRPGASYYRVYLGPYQSKADAEFMEKKLTDSGYPAIVVPEMGE